MLYESGLLLRTNNNAKKKNHTLIETDSDPDKVFHTMIFIGMLLLSHFSHVRLCATP